MIISTGELHERLNDSTFVIFDCRHDLGNPLAGEAMYAASHVTNARFAGVDTMLSSRPTGSNGRHPLPDPAAFADALASAGVGPGTTIVAYDQVGGQYAARLWWLARWIGHERALVLRVWRLLDRAEYKRRQAPPGVKITARAFGRDRRVPITNRYRGLRS